MPISLLSAPPVATYGQNEPDRTRANQVIQTRLLSEPQYQAVLKLVENYLPKFDIINMVCAMHACAITARDQEMLKKQIQFDPAFVKLFHTTKEYVLENVADTSARTLSDFLWCCSRLDIFDSELFNQVIASATYRLETFSAHGISLLVFALGYVGQRPRAVFMQALVREMRARIDTEFQPSHISTIVYGMMRMEIRDDRLMKIVSDHLIRTGFFGWDDLSLVCLGLAYSKLEYWNARVFTELGKSLMVNLNELRPRMLTMTSLCFAYSAGKMEDSRFMESVLKTMEVRLDEFSNRELSTVAFAAGKHMKLTEEMEEAASATFKKRRFVESENPFAKEIVEQVNKRSQDSFTMEEHLFITYGLMRLRHRDQRFLQQTANQFAMNAAELTPAEIVQALYAFARLEFVHLQFLHAMLAEVRRRNLIDEEMDDVQLATLAYSLAVSRIVDEEIMDKIASRACQRIREFSGQHMSMVLWAMAVTNTKTHAEAVVSACMEEMSMRPLEIGSVSISICMWAAAILTGPSSALWFLKTLFSPRFWSQEFEETAYSMMYYMYTSLRVEEGIAADELDGWYMCRRLYEVSSGDVIGSQNQRLAERLRMQQVKHKANAMVPAREGFPEAGVRADIVIEELNLVIEVEGPQRMTIPLEKAVAEFGDREVFGTANDVINELRPDIECGLTGSAAFKRRLLRTSGWRTVTVSFDENEEYIADALCRLVNKDGRGGAEQPERQENAGTTSEEASEVGPAAADVDSVMDSLEGGSSLTGSSTTQKEEESSKEFSDYETRFREQHSLALEELKRRILEQRGNAAAYTAFADHLEYRRWQVGLEKEVLQELVAAM